MTYLNYAEKHPFIIHNNQTKKNLESIINNIQKKRLKKIQALAFNGNQKIQISIYFSRRTENIYDMKEQGFLLYTWIVPSQTLVADIKDAVFLVTFWHSSKAWLSCSYFLLHNTSLKLVFFWRRGKVRSSRICYMICDQWDHLKSRIVGQPSYLMKDDENHWFFLI